MERREQNQEIQKIQEKTSQRPSPPKPSSQQNLHHRFRPPDVEEALSSMLWTPYENTTTDSSSSDEDEKFKTFLYKSKSNCDNKNLPTCYSISFYHHQNQLFNQQSSNVFNQYVPSIYRFKFNDEQNNRNNNNNNRFSYPCYGSIPSLQYHPKLNSSCVQRDPPSYDSLYNLKSSNNYNDDNEGASSKFNNSTPVINNLIAQTLNATTATNRCRNINLNNNSNNNGTNNNINECNNQHAIHSIEHHNNNYNYNNDEQHRINLENNDLINRINNNKIESKSFDKKFNLTTIVDQHTPSTSSQLKNSVTSKTILPDDSSINNSKLVVDACSSNLNPKLETFKENHLNDNYWSLPKLEKIKKNKECKLNKISDKHEDLLHRLQNALVTCDIECDKTNNYVEENNVYAGIEFKEIKLNEKLQENENLTIIKDSENNNNNINNIKDFFSLSDESQQNLQSIHRNEERKVSKLNIQKYIYGNNNNNNNNENKNSESYCNEKLVKPLQKYNSHTTGKDIADIDTSIYNSAELQTTIYNKNGNTCNLDTTSIFIDRSIQTDDLAFECFSTVRDFNANGLNDNLTAANNLTNNKTIFFQRSIRDLSDSIKHLFNKSEKKLYSDPVSNGNTNNGASSSCNQNDVVVNTLNVNALINNSNLLDSNKTIINNISINCASNTNHNENNIIDSRKSKRFSDVKNYSAKEYNNSLEMRLNVPGSSQALGTSTTSLNLDENQRLSKNTTLVTTSSSDTLGTTSVFLTASLNDTALPSTSTNQQLPSAKIAITSQTAGAIKQQITQPSLTIQVNQNDKNNIVNKINTNLNNSIINNNIVNNLITNPTTTTSLSLNEGVNVINCFSNNSNGSSINANNNNNNRFSAVPHNNFVNNNNCATINSENNLNRDDKIVQNNNINKNRNNINKIIATSSTQCNSNNTTTLPINFINNNNSSNDVCNQNELQNNNNINTNSYCEIGTGLPISLNQCVSRTFTSTECQTDDISLNQLSPQQKQANHNKNTPSTSNSNPNPNPNNHGGIHNFNQTDALISREQRRRERRERRQQARNRALLSPHHPHMPPPHPPSHPMPPPMHFVQNPNGPCIRPPMIPDILHSHFPPPYAAISVPNHPQPLPPPPGPPLPGPPPHHLPQPTAIISTMPIGSATGVNDGRFTIPLPVIRRSPSERSGKGCCGQWFAGPPLRALIAVVALGGVACALGGAALGATGLAGPPTSHLTAALLMIGVGVVLVTVSGAAWRMTAPGGPPCLGLGSTVDLGRCGRRPCSSRGGAPHGLLYPEFQHRPPPPSYQASMQEYRLRLLLLDRDRQNGVVRGGSPPPTYRSHAGSLLRTPLTTNSRAGGTINSSIGGPGSEYSLPPSYRSRNINSTPTANGTLNSITTRTINNNNNRNNSNNNVNNNINNNTNNNRTLASRPPTIILGDSIESLNSHNNLLESNGTTLLPTITTTSATTNNNVTTATIITSDTSTTTTKITSNESTEVNLKKLSTNNQIDTILFTPSMTTITSGQNDNEKFNPRVLGNKIINNNNINNNSSICNINTNNSINNNSCINLNNNFNSQNLNNCLNNNNNNNNNDTYNKYRKELVTIVTISATQQQQNFKNNNNNNNNHDINQISSSSEMDVLAHL